MPFNNETTCDACLNEVDGVHVLTEYAGQLVCDECMSELNEMIDDHFNDHGWTEAEAEAEAARWDDDPNPYLGTYSEE